MIPVINPMDTCLLVRWCPARATVCRLRWRDLDLGSLGRLIVALELREPVVVMTSERHKRRPRGAKSTIALHRDGQIRSNDKTAVMAVERRDLVTWPTETEQLHRRLLVATRRNR